MRVGLSKKEAKKRIGKMHVHGQKEQERMKKIWSPKTKTSGGGKRENHPAHLRVPTLGRWSLRMLAHKPYLDPDCYFI